MRRNLKDYGVVPCDLGFSCYCFLGALLCVLGFTSAVIVSTLDKIGMRQLGLDGAIQEESRKVVQSISFNNNNMHT